MQNQIDELYRGAQDPKRVGGGSTFDAVKWEQANPGATVGGKTHNIKLQERVDGINKILRTDRTLSPQDRDAANKLLDQAEELGYYPRFPRG